VLVSRVTEIGQHFVHIIVRAVNRYAEAPRYNAKITWIALDGRHWLKNMFVRPSKHL